MIVDIRLSSKQDAASVYSACADKYQVLNRSRTAGNNFQHRSSGVILLPQSVNDYPQSFRE
jgi:hypothetical protein